MALVTTIITDTYLWSGSVLVDVHGYGGVISLGSSQGLCLRNLHSAWTDGLFQFSESSVEVVQVMDNGLPVV